MRDVNIHKPSSLHPLNLQIILDNRKALPGLLRALEEDIRPLPQGGALRDLDVVAPADYRRFGALDPAAGPADAVRVGEEGVPVCHGAEEPLHVDVVGGVFVERPWLGAVFDFTGGECGQSSGWAMRGGRGDDGGDLQS